MRVSKKVLIVSACAATAWLALSSTGLAQTCPAIPVDCLEPRPLAQISGVRFAWGSTGGDGWVARFDRGTKNPIWRVSIGGSGDDSVTAVTLNRGGREVLVAGISTSPTLTGFPGRNAGGRDGFVARLDVATGRVVSGAFVGGSGDEAATGVASDAAGNVLVSGVGTPAAFGAPPATLNVVEPTSSATASPAFLATLDASLSRPQSLFALGPIKVKNPRVWVDCNGNIVVGVVALGGGNGCAGNWPDLVYEQDQINGDYNTDHDWNNPNVGFPPGGWGYHALRWKDYHANAALQSWDPPYILDWLLAPTGVEIPKWTNPDCTEAGVLNQLETAVFLQNSVATDPPGGWVCGSHADKAQLALYSAHFFHRWGTPVYTHFGFYDTLEDQPWPWYTTQVAVERVTFEPFCPFDPNAYNGETLDDLCDLGVDNVSQLTCTSSDGIPGVPGNNYFLRFKEFEGAEWGLPLVWWGRPAIWSPNITYQWQEWYEPGEYVMDPPAASSAEVALLQEAARQSAGQVVRQGTVQVTRLNKGAAACKQTVDAVIPASE